MKLITLNKITDGMVLARNIYTRKGNVLLVKDAYLKSGYIGRLAEWGVNSVYVVDKQGDTVEIDQELYLQAQDDLLQLVEDFFNELAEEQLPPSLKQTIGGVTAKIISDDQILRSLVEVRAMNVNAFRRLGMNCIFSILIGDSAGYDSVQSAKMAAGVISLATGQMETARNLLGNSGPHRGNLALPCQHSESLERLYEFHLDYENAVRVVLERHENNDNNNLPRELEGNTIYQQSPSFVAPLQNESLTPMNILEGESERTRLFSQEMIFHPAKDGGEHFEISAESGVCHDSSLFRHLIEVLGNYNVELNDFNRGDVLSQNSAHIRNSKLIVTPEQFSVTQSEALMVVKRELTRLDPEIFPPKVIETTKTALGELLASEELVNGLVTIQALDGNAFYHCLSVNSLSVMVGASMGLTPSRLKELGIARLWVDSGKMQVARKYHLIEGLLENSPSDPWVMKASRLSFERLWEQKTNPQDPELTFRQEHGLSPVRCESGEFVREQNLVEIVALADTYLVLTSQGINGQKLMPHEVIEYIRDCYGTHNPEVKRAFLQCITPFLIGSYVLLNNGEKGKVLKVNQNFLARPIIQVLYDQNGRKLPVPTQRDLKTDLTLFIVSALKNDEFDQ